MTGTFQPAATNMSRASKLRQVLNRAWFRLTGGTL